MSDKWTTIPIHEWEERKRTDLIQDAGELIEMDRKVVRAIVESEFENLPALISNFRDKKMKVKKGLAELRVLEGIDDSAKELLLKVQKTLPTDEIIEKLEKRTGEGASFYELSEQEASKYGDDLFYSWISHYDFIRNIFKVNTVILGTKIPNPLRQYIIEARDCFALFQHNAVVSMCRTILEAAAKDICERKGFFDSHNKIREINPKIFNQLITAIASGKLRKRAVKIYFRDACPVVHGNRAIDADEALRVLQ